MPITADIGTIKLVRHTTETSAAGDVFIAQLQVAHRIHADVQDDLAVFYKGHRHLRVLIHLHRQIRRVSGIGAPLIDGANQVGLGGKFAHAKTYLRIAFSAGVIASI